VKAPSTVNGLLVLAKPLGPSSNDVLQQLRRHLGGAKAGHAGTLDPAAAGVLLVCLGEAAKLVPFLADLEKEYRGVVRFGAETDSQDATGAVTGTAPWEHLEEDAVRREMAGFLGESLQLPPMFSAIKVEGRRLYKSARKGQEVAREPRPIRVSAFELLAWRPPDGEFLVRCGSGTYVRTLCRDLGERLGTRAHMASLTRTAVGPFRLEDAVTLEELAARAPGAPVPRLIGLAAALAHLPGAVLSAEEARAVGEGRAPIMPPGRLPVDVLPGAVLKLLDERGRLLAVVRVAGEGAPLVFERVFHDG
jgi:tRNA pseudouridine55 synthase